MSHAFRLAATLPSHARGSAGASDPPTFLRALRLCALMALGVLLFLVAHVSSAAEGAMKPMLRLGPQEQLAGALAVPGYGLRACQVGLSVGACYDPYQMRKAYQFDSLIAQGYDGSGQTIVIVDAFQHPNLLAQVATFNSYYGLPPVNLTQYAPDGLTPFNSNDPNMLGWAEEISLDVEWAHAMAPGANIALVLAKSNSDADIASAIKYAVDNNLGNVISMSFGDNESCVGAATLQAYHDTFVQATLKHITLIASSGDQGATQPTCNGSSWSKAVSSPANDPLVTAVGGTELTAASFCLTALGCDPATHPAPGTYQSEIGWNEGPKYGDYADAFGNTLASGGGYSTVFAAPPYQMAALRGIRQRAVPDVAFNAAVLHGVLTRLDIPGVPPGWYRFGGTSAGAPQWAALIAIANERAGHPLGFINAALYQIGRAGPMYPQLFHDISSGTNSAIEFDSTNTPVDIAGFGAGVGWDAMTGLGSPSQGGLAATLGQFVASHDSDGAINAVVNPSTGSPAPGQMKPH